MRGEDRDAEVSLTEGAQPSRRHDAAWYMLEPSRSEETIRNVLGEYEGVVMCDAYSAYE